MAQPRYAHAARPPAPRTHCRAPRAPPPARASGLSAPPPPRTVITQFVRTPHFQGRPSVFMAAATAALIPDLVYFSFFLFRNWLNLFSYVCTRPGLACFCSVRWWFDMSITKDATATFVYLSAVLYINYVVRFKGEIQNFYSFSRDTISNWLYFVWMSITSPWICSLRWVNTKFGDGFNVSICVKLTQFNDIWTSVQSFLAALDTAPRCQGYVRCKNRRYMQTCKAGLASFV